MNELALVEPEHAVLFSRCTGNPDGCWMFTGTKDKLGYGKLRRRGRSMLAHRVAFLVVNGYLPANRLVCHKCDNPSCINPQHLFLGTNKTNRADCVRKGRHAVPHVTGERHGMAKLRPSDVLTIRALCRDGVRQKAIAAQFGISQPSVSDINTRRKWSHI